MQAPLPHTTHSKPQPRLYDGGYGWVWLEGLRKKAERALCAWDQGSAAWAALVMHARLGGEVMEMKRSCEISGWLA